MLQEWEPMLNIWLTFEEKSTSDYFTESLHRAEHANKHD